jgi:outer membrane lipoprotein-sorting protein
LKTALLGDVRRVGDRWYPFRIEMDDAMQTDTRTVLQMLEVQLGVAVPNEVFTLPHLEGGE